MGEPLTAEEQELSVKTAEAHLQWLEANGKEVCCDCEQVLRWHATVQAAEARLELLEYICHMEGADIAGYEQAERELDDEDVGARDGIGVRSVFA